MQSATPTITTTFGKESVGPAVEGAIYFKEIQRAQANGQITFVPYDPLRKVQIVVDLGWNDAMSIALVQKGHSSLNYQYPWKTRTGPSTVTAPNFKAKALHWGKVWLPHDGFSGNIQSGGKSVADIFKRLGWDVASKDEVVQLSVEDGIRNARMMFGQVAFNAAKCERLVECLKRYRRRINRQTNEEAAPLHDEYSHGADCFRYICCNAGQDDERGKTPAHHGSRQPRSTGCSRWILSRAARPPSRTKEARAAAIQAFALGLLESRKEAIEGRVASGVERRWSEDQEAFDGLDEATRNAGMMEYATGTAPVRGGDVARSRVIVNIVRAKTETAAGRFSDIAMPGSKEEELGAGADAWFLSW